MPQLSIEIDEATLHKIQEAAKQENLSISKYVIQKLNKTVGQTHQESDIEKKPSAYDILNKIQGHQLFHTVKDVDSYIRSERDSWDQ